MNNKPIQKAQFGTVLKKIWNTLGNSAQVAQIAEAPSVMTASGWRVDRNGKAVQDQQNNPAVKQLRDNLATIGEAAVTAPTAVKDVELAYQAVRHPIQTARAVKTAVQEGTKVVKQLVAKGKNAVQRFKESRNGNVTQNFLKFVGGNGNPTTPAIPRTTAQIEMYDRLKSAGVNMDKIGIEDIDKALQLREEALLSSGKSFSYQQPVTRNSEIIYSIDNGMKTGYIDLRKPFLTNDRGFAQEAWEAYKNNPRKKGLGIGMVKNSTQTAPNKYTKQYKGIQERLTNSAIDVAKQQGYEGVVSGEVLLSPERTTRMYPKYKHKRVLDYNGRYHWQNHNPGMVEDTGPVYMLEEPTFKTITKSQVFDPTIINKEGKMRINWGKGSTMFNSFAIPTIFGSYLFATQE